MTRPEALYRVLLRCYPAAFRQEYGDQMFYMFAEQLRDAQRSPMQRAALWIHAALDALNIAPKEHMHVILQDLRYAFRTMAASPTFTSVAILSLALGIGANTAIFSLWNSVLHASLPVVYKPEQLVMLSDPNFQGMWSGRWISRTDGDRAVFTYSEYQQFRDDTQVFSAVMASQSSLNTWQVDTGKGEQQDVRARLVSSGYFQVLGVSPIVGHAFSAPDDSGEAPYAVISYNYWQRRFGGHPDALGKTLRIGKALLTIIGVAPPGFIGETSGQHPDLWIPLGMQPEVMAGQDRLHDKIPEKTMWLNIFARLKPGVSQAQAEAQANSLFKAGLETFYSGAPSAKGRMNEFLDQQFHIRPAARGASAIRNKFSDSLTTLLAGVAVLLLIACGNLANLLLARGAARRPEMALRISLGASRGRLLRQLITESMALAALGGLGGLAISTFLHAALVQLVGRYDEDFQMSFSVDPLVLAFTFGATLLAALLFGVLPAWQITNTNGGENLREQGRGAVGSSGRMAWGRLLVSLQLGLSLPLLVGAGLLAQTVYNLQRVDLGYPANHLLLVRIDSREGYDEPRRENLFRKLLEDFQRNPGVRAASFSTLGVFSGGNIALEIQVEGYIPKGDDDRGSFADSVGPGYFSALGVPLLLGRDILDNDRAGSPRACVINEAFAKKFFDGRNPIGKQIRSMEDKAPPPCQVVGVAGNARTQTLRRSVEPRFYMAVMQPPSGVMSPTFLIRTAGDSAPVLKDARQTIQHADASIPILSAVSIEEQLAPLTAQDRAMAQLIVAFGVVAILLAAIGLYGVLSYGIARRRGEIAIRIAVGARPGRVIAMILRETLGLIIVGLVLGVGLALGTSHWITSQLYGVAPQDPVTLALAADVLVVVALSATYLPAQQAASLDPMAALRRE
jgi:predicted permease